MFGLFKTFRNAFVYVYFKLFQLFKAAIYVFRQSCLVESKSCSIYRVRDKRDTKKKLKKQLKTTEPKPQLGAFGPSNKYNIAMAEKTLKYRRIKNCKLSSLAAYTEGAKCTICFHKIQVQGKVIA